MAILNLIDQISCEIDNKIFSMGIFIDLSKAFDTLDHKIVIDKLYHYGIRGIIILIMLAYLYCAAYTRMTMNESSPPCEQRRIKFNDDGQRVQLARPELTAPHYICMYRLLPTTLYQYGL